MASPLERVQRLVDQADGLAANEMNSWKERVHLAVVAIYGDGSDQVRRLDDIRWSLGIWSDSTPRHAFAEARQRGLRNSVGFLQAVIEDLEEKEGLQSLPGFDPEGFHPWVAQAAGNLWQDGHRREAVRAAASALEVQLRAKTNLHRGSVASIVVSAFSPNDPKPGLPRLRLSGFDPIGSDDWNSAHEGAGAFGRGCFLRIRNLYVHRGGRDEREDLEALAALSLLARWIEVSEVVR
jgi:hypothetical protein